MSSHPLSTLPVTLRPERSLLVYYLLASLVAGPGYPILLAYQYFRYRTMRYQVDEEGIIMRWGVLFRREISLTYARIQDIHLESNFVARWLGLAKIQVQTASGSAKAEMTIEGLRNPEGIRDFLYSRMRGARVLPAKAGGATAGQLPSDAIVELTATLREIAAEVRALREALPASMKQDALDD